MAAYSRALMESVSMWGPKLRSLLHSSCMSVILHGVVLDRVKKDNKALNGAA